MNTFQAVRFDATEAQNTIPNDSISLMAKWWPKIKSQDGLADILSEIESVHKEVNEAITGCLGLDEWFNAFICTDAFAGLEYNQKRSIVKAKDGVTYLLGAVDDFMAANRLGQYSY